MESTSEGAKISTPQPITERVQKGERVTVQDFSSRFNTPRIRLSNEAWEQYGLGPFSSENVPFAGRTGMVFAEKVVKIAISRLKPELISRDNLHLYEFGSGTGLLSKHILDILKAQHPDIYKKAQIHISDISPVSIQRIKDTGVFQEHEGHIIYEVVDAANPKFSDKPLLVYHTYLADSLPTRHIEVVDGRAREIQVKTLVKKGAKIVDTTQDPPIVLDEEAIAILLNELNHDRRRILAPRLLSAIEETYLSIPIEQTVSDPKEKSAIEALAKNQKSGRFNYSYLVDKSIQEIVQALDGGGGMLLISDYGRTKIGQTSTEQLTTNFGVTAACPVDFPVLVEAGTKARSSVYVTTHRQCYPQEILFDTLQRDKVAQEAFERVFKDEGGEVVDIFLGQAESIIKSKTENAGKSSQIRKIYNDLPDNYKFDFQLLNNLSNMLVENGLNADAIEFSTIVIEDAGHVCGPSFRIRARASAAIGRLADAETDLKKAVSISEMDSKAYAYIANLYKAQHKDKEYVEAKKRYLRCSRSNDILQTMLEIADAYETMGEKDVANKTLSQIVQIANGLGDAIDQREKKIAEKAQGRKLD